MDTEQSGDRPGFLKRHGVTLGVIAAISGGAFAVSQFLKGGEKAAPKKTAEVAMVRVAPPPPPPKLPEPKPKEPEPETPKEPDPATPQMIAAPDDNKPPAPEQAPAAPADAPMGTSIQGSGNDGFGLAYSRTGGGNSIGGTGLGGSGSGGSGSNGFGWYAGRVQSRVSKALAENKTTRAASLSVKVRVWADAAGRITRAALAGSTGDTALDEAIRGEVLTGLVLDEPPPAGMPMPIVMRISGRRP